MYILQYIVTITQLKDHYSGMTELINLKIKAAISITSIITSWLIAQASVIDQGFDQLFSLGLLVVAVIVIWKAFSKKDESETRLLREQIDILQDILKDQRETINRMDNRNGND